MLSGDNGILQKATDAKTNTDNAQIKERVQLAYTAAIAKGKGNLTESNLRAELANEFGDEYDLDEDTTTNEWIILVNEVERLRVNAGLKSDSVEIVYRIYNNTIKMNFKQQGYEELFLNWVKKNDSMYSYLSNKYPGREITIELIYKDYFVSSLEELASQNSFSNVQEFLITIGATTAEDIANIEDITGKITLKKDNTIITEGNVSQSNWLEYNLTESGNYTIIGESNGENKTIKNFEIIVFWVNGPGNCFIAEPGMTFGELINTNNYLTRLMSVDTSWENKIKFGTGPTYVTDPNAGDFVTKDTPITENKIYGVSYERISKNL